MLPLISPFDVQIEVSRHAIRTKPLNVFRMISDICLTVVWHETSDNAVQLILCFLMYCCIQCNIWYRF